MNKYFRNALCAVLSAACLSCFAACGKNNTDIPTESYVYHPAGELTTSGAAEETTAVTAEKINVDTSWRNNFSVKYAFFNSKEENKTVNVCEKRSENYFSAEDVDSGDTLFYKNNGGNIDSYVIVPDETEQIRSVIKGKTLSDLSSTFMKLSDIDENMPSRPNVMFMNNEQIAGRDCAKYIQRAYTNGKLTETDYVWIDLQYGFAAKGEIRDGKDEITLSWEISEFQAGGVTDNDVKIDLSRYKITEE